ARILRSGVLEFWASGAFPFASSSLLHPPNRGLTRDQIAKQYSAWAGHEWMLEKRVEDPLRIWNARDHRRGPLAEPTRPHRRSDLPDSPASVRDRVTESVAYRLGAGVAFVGAALGHGLVVLRRSPLSRTCWRSGWSAR